MRYGLTVPSVSLVLWVVLGWSAGAVITDATPDLSGEQLGLSADSRTKPVPSPQRSPPEHTPTDDRLPASTSAPTATQTAAPVKLSKDQMEGIAARRAACTSVEILTGGVVGVCQGSTASATVVPAGQPARPRVTAEDVRERAVDRIAFTKPVIGTSPCLADAAACKGTVGVPVWLWVGDGNGALPSESASATAGPFTIKATAKVSKVKWSLGDGQSTVCSGTGTKYNEAAHGWSAPECGFEHGWKKAGTYTLTATYVWDVAWSGDQTGSATQTMSSTQQVTVGELQSVVTKN